MSVSETQVYVEEDQGQSENKKRNEDVTYFFTVLTSFSEFGL